MMHPYLEIQKLINPIIQRVRLMLARGIVKIIDSDQVGQLRVMRCAILDGEELTFEQVQEFGFSSHPTKGSEALVVFVGGNREHGIVIGTEDRRLRINLDEGEAVIYGKDSQYVKMKNGGEIEAKASGDISIESTGGKVDITSDGDTDITVSGNASMTVVGNVNISTAAGIVAVDAPTVNIGPTAANVNLAGGGQPIARIGDSVDPVTHLILSGSSKATSG